MNKAIIFVLGGALALLIIAPLARAKNDAAKKAGAALFAPSGDLRWTEVKNQAGVQLAVVQGDSTRGSHHSFLKLAPGTSLPMHHHSSDHYVTVMSGTVVLTVDGDDHKLPAGSFFSLSGKKKHATRCEASAECVLSLDVRGRWDLVPESATRVVAKN
jgi:quercetin dioxygenase-like cupin family protein